MKLFFSASEIAKVCMYQLLYSCLLRPEVDQFASDFSNRILRRGRSEAKRIAACQSTAELIEMMRSGIDPLVRFHP
jgi:hypothetical protein